MHKAFPSTIPSFISLDQLTCITLQELFAGAALQEATLSGPLSKQPLNAQIK